MKLLATALAVMISTTAFQASAEEMTKGDQLVVSSLVVNNSKNLTAGTPYEAILDRSTTGTASVEMLQACFYWDKEGPFCWDDFESRKDATGYERTYMKLTTGNPGTYVLTGYMTYRFESKLYYTAPVAIKIVVN